MNTRMAAKLVNVRTGFAGIGAVLLKQGRVDEAKTILSKAATLTFVKLGERHQQSLDAMNWLAECKSTQRNMG